ncbi:hypothetical protein BBJ28_00007199 [Nothophytophthora sp. Chile5]|nr:hypothetical protein BBJ28_00007199 [Nothophytophthora sp. Chile5]
MDARLALWTDCSTCCSAWTRRIGRSTSLSCPIRRSPTPQEALNQVHLNYIASPGFEADDIIASYSAQYVAAGFDVLIVSNGNDVLQLVYDPRSGAPDAPRRYIRERNLKGRFGLRARLIPDLQELCGHRWHKIPKVDNMTGELAVELLTRYGGLFAMLRQLDGIEDPLLRKTLQHSISFIERSHRILKLQTDIALPVTIEVLRRPQLSNWGVPTAPAP